MHDYYVFVKNDKPGIYITSKGAQAEPEPEPKPRFKAVSPARPRKLFVEAHPHQIDATARPVSDACSICLDERFAAGAKAKLMFHCPLCDYNECLACACKRGPDAAHAVLLKLAL